MINRDDFTASVKEICQKRAAYICSNPDCRVLTIAPTNSDNTKFNYIGVIAHINAAAQGGPRYNDKMTNEERSGIENALFLCNNCATLIDKNGGADYPEMTLRSWKRLHEDWTRQNLNKNQNNSAQNIYNVTSVNQTGGITTGVLNVGIQKRVLDIKTESELLARYPDKEEYVIIMPIAGDPEAAEYAKQITVFFRTNGYTQVHPNNTHMGAAFNGWYIDENPRLPIPPNKRPEKMKRILMVGHAA